jgi:hypothetical protein
MLASNNFNHTYFIKKVCCPTTGQTIPIFLDLVKKKPTCATYTVVILFFIHSSCVKIIFFRPYMRLKDDGDEGYKHQHGEIWKKARG